MAQKKTNLTLDRLTPQRKNVDVRQAIRDRLKQLKWSRHLLAQRLGMRVGTVYDCLSEDGNPKLETVERMLTALGLEIRPAKAPAEHSSPFVSHTGGKHRAKNGRRLA